MSNDNYNDNYKFQGVPISDLIEPYGTIESTKYSGLKYYTTTDPAAKVGTDSFVSVFKSSGSELPELPSNIKAKEYTIDSNITIPEWANAFKFHIQTNAGADGVKGSDGEDGQDGSSGQSWESQVLVSHTGWSYYGYQRHEHRGAAGGAGGTRGYGGTGGDGGDGGKGKQVYSNFIPIESGSTIKTILGGFKIEKDDVDVFNINVNDATAGQNGFAAGNGNNGNNGNPAQSAKNKWNKQQGRHGQSGNNGNNGFRNVDTTNMNNDGNGKKGADGAASNVVSSSNDLVSSNRNSTTGATSKIYFFKNIT